MIVKMLHADVLSLASEKDAALQMLRSVGAVHLDFSMAQGPDVLSAKGDLANAEAAVQLIVRARGKNKTVGAVSRSVEDVLDIQKRIDESAAVLEDLKSEISKYEVYGDFDPVLAQKILDAGVDLSSVIDLPKELPQKRLSEMRREAEDLKNKINSYSSELKNTDENAILSMYPELADRLAFVSAKELMLERGAIAVISGWVPLPVADELRSRALSQGCALLMREPLDGEIPPTLITPPRLFKPMTSLFAGLGIAPAYNESDVSVPFLCYFSLFFAMLVGDGAYGAIFLLCTLALRRSLQRSWFILLTVFSVSTIVWGFLSNTWFGAQIPILKALPTATWLADPSYANMMLLCFSIGASHLILARLWNAVCKFPDITAIAELGWAGILLFMYLLTNSIVGIFSAIPSWGFYVLYVSLPMVFAFTVKPSELKSRGAELGMLPLNIMGALGDIISYVRLFAVGLASVKVAENFNSMATGLIGDTDQIWVKAIMSVAMVAILVAGHALNLAMAGLSILVHAVRLNTLEFSNHKGVSWSGVIYKPFRSKNYNNQGDK